MDTEETVAAVSPLFSRAGSAWYFVPETLEVGKRLGLDPLAFYVLGRGGVLGAVGWRTVMSAFGYFSPALIERTWTSAAGTCQPTEAATAHLGACADFGRRHLGGVEDLDAFCAAGRALVEVASDDLGGLTLFAGYASQPLPEDLPGRAMHLVATIRELRGSVHLVAVVASGLATPLAHAIRRPNDQALFGWGEGALPAPTEDDRRRLAEADRVTDELMAATYGRLGGDDLDALAGGARAIAAAVTGK